MKQCWKIIDKPFHNLKKYQIKRLHSLPMWLVIWSWKVINPQTLMQMLMISVVINRMQARHDDIFV